MQINKQTDCLPNSNHSASPTTELSVDYSFGLISMPSSAMPSSRLSLNGNALALTVSRPNSQMMPPHSLHPSKSNDTIHSHDLATITSNRAFQHFNIDEYYVPNDERNNVLGKQRKMTPAMPFQTNTPFCTKIQTCKHTNVHTHTHTTPNTCI